ncbi:MAG: glutathione S-transferase family protein [Oligoflexia bacterium]|nr:glutathione S-transferase family protein [Oligoflexia bacterium]
MNELILHSYRRCPFAIRVRTVLEEKGLKYSVIEEDLANPSSELLRLHPEGKVPLLLHHGHPIFESSVITEYLDEAFPEVSLMPRAPLERAEVRLWTFWCNELFKPDLDAYKYEWPGLSADERQALLARLKASLEKLDSALDKAAFLMGPQITLADIHVFPFYRQLQKARPEFHEQFKTRHVDAWLGRITSRPSFERVMKKPG